MTVAREVMSKSLIAVKDRDTVQYISGVLTKHVISGVPVVDTNKNVVGFVSERDIISSMSSTISKKKAKDIMTKQVVSAAANTPLEELSKLFSERPIKYIPIVENKKIVGVVSRKNVIDKLLGYYY